MSDKPLTVLSYGGGRQTAGMLAMVALGELPRPDMVLFADTGGEKPETYEHIRHWAEPLAGKLGIPFVATRHTVRNKPVALYDYCWRYRWLPQPWQRMCTRKFKVEAIKRVVRPYRDRGPIEMWLGISIEEAKRARPSRVKWIVNRHPLVDRGLSVHDCLDALRRAGGPEPVKSACFFCSFQKQHNWRQLATQHPDLFERAVALEERAHEVNPSVFLNGRALLRLYLEGEQLAWDSVLETEAGCASGVCFV